MYTVVIFFTKRRQAEWVLCYFNKSWLLHHLTLTDIIEGDNRRN